MRLETAVTAHEEAVAKFVASDGKYGASAPPGVGRVIGCIDEPDQLPDKSGGWTDDRN